MSVKAYMVSFWKYNILGNAHYYKAYSKWDKNEIFK